MKGKLAAEGENEEESEDEDIADLGEIEDLDIVSLFNGTNFDICDINELKEEENFNLLTPDQQYELHIRLLARYLKVYGLFEIKDGLSYAVFNTSVNPDTFSWKAYDDL